MVRGRIKTKRTKTKGLQYSALLQCKSELVDPMAQRIAHQTQMRQLQLVGPQPLRNGGASLPRDQVVVEIEPPHSGQLSQQLQ